MSEVWLPALFEEQDNKLQKDQQDVLNELESFILVLARLDTGSVVPCIVRKKLSAQICFGRHMADQ